MRHLLFTLALVGCADTVSPLGRGSIDAGPSFDALTTTDVATPRDVGAPGDVTRALSDECARGTWCWERPVPSGERAAGARVFAANDAVYVTVGGTLARWNGSAWRSEILSLPAPVRSLWAQRSDEVYLLCVSDNAPGMTQRSWLVRVQNGVPAIVGGPVEGFASGLDGASPSELWATNNRGLLRWNGATWSVLPGPGDVLLSGLAAVAPGELVVMESWGSGSGTGRLHRFDGSRWSLLTSFEGLRLRVEAPLVPLAGALWMSAWNSGESQPEIVRYDLTTQQSEVITPPTDTGSVSLYAVGGALWASYGARAWRREGARWVATPNIPSAFGAQITAAPDGEVWFFGDTVSRLREGGWRAFGSPTEPTLGFWRDDLSDPALVVQRPGALAVRAPQERSSWPLSRLVDEAVMAWTPAGDDGGWIATERAIVRVRDRRAGDALRWPPGGRGGSLLGAWSEALWTVSERGIERNARGEWLDAVELPRVMEAPRSAPRVTAMRGVSSNTVLFSTELITGDKQVYVNLYSLSGTTVTPIASLRGVFGGSSELRIAGSLPNVWIAFDGLRRWDGAQLRVAEESVNPLDLQVFQDGHAVGTDGDRVYVWTADGRRLSAIAVPQMQDLRWSFVHGGADGSIRVAAGGGQVLRYTP